MNVRNATIVSLCSKSDGDDAQNANDGKALGISIKQVVTLEMFVNDAEVGKAEKTILRCFVGMEESIVLNVKNGKRNQNLGRKPRLHQKTNFLHTAKDVVVNIILYINENTEKNQRRRKMTAKNNGQTSIVLGSKAGLQKFLDNPKTVSMIKAMAGKYLTAERITKMIMLAANRQPRLFDCTPRSFLDACMKSAELGLDFGGATGQAYLVPFRNGPLSKKHNRTVLDCQFIPGYQGLIELCYRGGSATYVDAQLVYQKDKFKYNLGSEPKIEFEPNLDEEDRGDVKCAFAAIRLKDSPYPKLEIMTKSQLLAIKGRSKAKDRLWSVHFHLRK